MKILIVILFALLSVTSFAKTKATKAERKAAKEACMQKDSTLKGKKLKACIKEELKMEEKGETKGEEKAEKSEKSM